MKCKICHEKIKQGDTIFRGYFGTCAGPSEYDFSFASDCGVSIHLKCLEKSAEATTIPGTEPHEYVEEHQELVERSNALGLFGDIL